MPFDNVYATYAFYFLLICVDLLAGYFKVIDATLATALFTGIVGHFLGIQVPTPTTNNPGLPTANKGQ